MGKSGKKSRGGGSPLKVSTIFTSLKFELLLLYFCLKWIPNPGRCFSGRATGQRSGRRGRGDQRQQTDLSHSQTRSNHFADSQNSFKKSKKKADNKVIAQVYKDLELSI